LDRETLATKIEPPNELGDQLSDNGVWSIRDRTGKDSGYIFETGTLAPLPGFSGAPINVLVTLDRDGKFLRAELLEHNEPVFVSGLGEAPFHEFVRQYRGLSVFDSVTVGVPYGAANQGGSGQIYLDGVTKATASVRIAHESILAASLAVSREHVQGLAGGPSPRPKRGEEGATLDWHDLVEQGIATRRIITNNELQAAFNDSLWEADDAEALSDPEGNYMDLWVIDIGPDAIARAVLDDNTLAERDELLTSPDLLLAEQNGLPIALRHAVIDVETAEGVPEFEHRMIIRTDRRLGFNPTLKWDLIIRAVRHHGSFMARRIDLVVLTVFLIVLSGLLLFRQHWVAVVRRLRPFRLGVLAFTLFFIGWWGQGQLSIVTVIGTLRAAVEGTGFLFLLYDPFSLLVWVAAILGFVLWGRGLFCGWLCPYGALQEFADRLGRMLGIKRRRVPEGADRILKGFKYLLLALLIITAFTAPILNDLLVEVEPFKTAITVGFVREWWYVAYAIGWLIVGMLFFKPFCRYVCPLGAIMALGGLLRLRRWIPRRADCGSSVLIASQYMTIENNAFHLFCMTGAR